VRLPFLSLKSKSIIGLDIGSSSVKAVEVSVRPKGIELLHLGVAPLPPEAIVQGGHSVIVKKISLPEMTRDELEESIRWEAEQYIPFDINEVNLDFQILEQRDGEGQMEVLLAASKKDLIDDYCAVITEAGLRPAVIDVAAFAVANAFEANYEVQPDEVVALVNIGAQTVNLNILANGVPAFTRDVSTGGNQYTEEIQKTLSVGFEEAERIKLGGDPESDGQEVVPQEVEEAMSSVTETVIGEISRSLDFFQATAAESRISRILLSGGGAKISGLEKAFHERTQLPVEKLNPLGRMLPSTRYQPEFIEQVAPALGVGVGLALRRMDF
jgi:type IV pilus assembly protein PilM